jgi:large subunit ribosomal protein L28
MAMKCDFCLKGVQHGHKVSHAKNRTNRVYKPNLHACRVVVGTTSKKVKLCTKCLRMYKKMQKALVEMEDARKTVAAVTA